MLVLSRKINESIQIGTDVEVTVIDVRGDVVRLGIFHKYINLVMLLCFESNDLSH